MKRTIRKFSLSFIVPAMALAVLLTACGDDSSSGVDSVPVEPGESSSSSVVSGAAPDVTPDPVPGSNSSSSEGDEGSSPSVTPDPVPGSNSSSSSEGESSSSSVTPSSSGTMQSSSSVNGASSSSTPIEDLSSSSSEQQVEQSSSSVTVVSSSSSTPIENPDSKTAVVMPDGYYSNSSNCPAGLTCKYATTTEYLNSTKTYGEILDIRDGQVYKTIEICDKDNKSCQTWMAQNLNYALDPEKVSSMGDNAWSGCYGDGSHDYSSDKDLTDEEVAANCSKYGRLYTWEVAMNDAACASGKECKASLNPATPVQGVCPQGWHLPSHREFATLINYIDPDFGYDRYDGKSVIAGRELKSQSGWNPGLTISGNGTDSYGFSALPGGNRVCVVAGDCGFISVGSSADFWSSGEGNSEKAFRFGLSYDCGDVKLTAGFKILVGAVRCLRD